MTPPVIARLWHRLMRDGLGYSRFGAAGGDWGSFTSSELGTQFPQDVIGIYLSYPPRFHVDVENLPDSDYDESESDWLSRQKVHRATNLSHVPVQSNGPQTLAWRKACERVVNLAQWSVQPRGGHFAAAEQPELYVQDLRNLFRPLRA